MTPGVIAPDDARPSPGAKSWVRKQVEAQATRWRLWAPVFFGIGCALYFALPVEPPAWPVVMGAVVLALAAVWAWRGGGWLVVPVTLLAFAGAGLAVAKLRSDAVAAPVAVATGEPVAIEGWIVDVATPGARGSRMVLAPTWIDGVDAAAIPHRLNLSLDGGTIRPGTPVRVFGILNPPPATVSPGSFDFGRNAWFQSIGGNVFVLGEPRDVRLREPPWPIRLEMGVNAERYDLGLRILERIGQPAGGIAAAMVVGHEAWISEEDQQAMRDSGLAHILSISGLHMAIVGGFVFFMVRLAVAAWPWLALRVPGKKVAAWAGIVAVAVYLVISGTPAPAERAAVVAWVAFAAILLDRRAVSMNALALAALIVLLRRPESVVMPGFQMSFAATAALVALAESWPPRLREISAPWPILLVQRTGSWIGVALAASLVAGLATGPFAMQHFNRSAMYGLFANLAVAPISSFVMMPALAVGAVLETMGLGGPALALAGWSIDAMLWIGRFTAGLPGAVATIASAPAAALPIAFLGLLFICLWKGRLRWLGLPFACAVLLWPRAAAPDVWVAENGTNLALRVGDQAQLVRPTVGLFGAELWSRRRGLVLVGAGVEDRAERTCRRSWCALRVDGQTAAVWFGRRAPDEAQLAEMCAAARIVVVRTEVASLPESCDGLVLDAVDRARGAAELWRVGDGWRGVWADDLSGDRPWVR